MFYLVTELLIYLTVRQPVATTDVRVCVSVCNQASLGVAAIFGPRSSSIASYINSMCNTLEVPHVEARLDARSGAGHVFSLNVHPQAAQLGRVYLDLLQYFGWTKFCVVYGEHSGQSVSPRDGGSTHAWGRIESSWV